MRLGGETENRERLENSRVETERGGGGGRDGINEEDELRSPGIAATVTGTTAAGAEEIPTRIKMETEHEDHYEEQNDDRAKHDSAA